MKKILLILVSGIFLSACYHTSKPTVVTPVPQRETSKSPAVVTNEGEVTDVEISGFKFAPETLKVKPGQTIKVTNRDSVSHTVTADDGTSFESGLLGKDQSGTITAPTKPGSYGFHCTPHPYMKGTLVVE